MKFGVREICDVTFKALQDTKIGNMEFNKGAPVLYIDSAKTSTMEGAATTVYAQGGKGNARLIAWEGEKTLTFTVEDALLSEVGFSILSGAGVFDAAEGEVAYVHTTAIAEVVAGDATDKIANIYLDGENETIANNAPVFVMEYKDGSIGKMIKTTGIAQNKDTITITLNNTEATQVFVDFYVKKQSLVTELQIDADTFGGFYYVEASTLFRRESDGKDLPAELVIPKVKIQSNFTFAMSSSGDPSTFTFTMDAMPGYTWFNRSKKVLCAMQVIDDNIKSVARKAVTFADNDRDFDSENLDSGEPDDPKA